METHGDQPDTVEGASAPGEGAGRGRLRRGRRRGIALAALGACAVAVGGVAIAATTSGSDSASADSPSTSVATTEIKRKDLVETDSETGTLGYADERQVVNHLSGTITWLPAEGDLVHLNRALYKVDGEPVVLMNGTQPAYRTLSSSSSSAGHDVGQLEHDLRALGYDAGKDMKVDGEWDAGTTAAIKRWQEAHGLSQDGAIELGRLVFQPHSRRVTSVNAALGASSGGGSAGEAPASTSTSTGTSTATGGGGAGATAGSSSSTTPSNTIMTTTSNRKVVTVDLQTTKSSLAKRGARVSVELPSGKTVHGRISDVGKVATKESSSSSDATTTSSSSNKATIELTIELFDRGEALDQAPVTVEFEQSRVKDVLSIPVTALLAQPGGRFAVEVIDDGTRRLVPVTPGTYTSGYVEIEGQGLQPGMKVTNAAVQ